MLKLTKHAQKRITKTKYVPLQSTFVTKDGPAVGTIWFDREQPNNLPNTVREVQYRGDGNYRVNYVTYGWDSLPAFLSYVEVGRYVLIGVKLPAMSHIDTGHR